MNYYEYSFSIFPNKEFIGDILSALLAEIGFESFVQTGEGLTAYIASENFDPKLFDDALSSFKADYPAYQIRYRTEDIAPTDWNEEWEKHYFNPIIIDDQCVIHSSFHKDIPKMRYDILIDPKMAFGTGHHETTSLMISAMTDIDLTRKSVLDMGCGTAVLAILAAMKGADPVVAIDIDEWAYNNSLENIRLNRTENISVKHGGAEILGTGDVYDYIFANINRNILLNDMHHYVRCMRKGSVLFMSGFYVTDIPAIQKEAGRLGLDYAGFSEKNNWVAVRFNF
ncbi:MAG: 50S ribosomal protein L11 methyltransferase [Candidatus Azobacteroides sp.]|nr:50S ribosomal protein L11 methyltransferase [Candidatus Azobacteroides sp.]